MQMFFAMNVIKGKFLYFATCIQLVGITGRDQISIQLTARRDTKGSLSTMLVPRTPIGNIIAA